MQQNVAAPAQASQAPDEPGIAAPATDVPYSGLLSQTRFESVHIAHANGSQLSVPLCRVLNAHTHPELRERALLGTLYRLEDGRELATPFIYHDPAARKFAVVLPLCLAHTELQEWARVAAELAADTAHVIPRYVFSHHVVVGQDALRKFIEAAPSTPASSDTGVSGDVSAEATQPPAANRPDDAGAETASAAQLTAWEHKLAAHERELQDLQNALQHLSDELSTRERELSRREGRLVCSDLSDSKERRRVYSDLSDLEERRQQVRPDPAPEPRDEELSYLRAQRYKPPMPAFAHVPSVPPPLPMSRYRLTPPPLPASSVRTRELFVPLTAARVDSDAEASPVLAATRRASSVPPPLPPQAAEVALAVVDKDPEPEIAPPESFTAQPAGQCALKLVDDELWLFARLEDLTDLTPITELTALRDLAEPAEIADSSELAELDESTILDETRSSALPQGLELMLQYVEVEDYPLALLSLLGQSPNARPARAVLDGYARRDVAVVEHLSRSFRARVALYSGDAYQETVTVASLREGVAQAILDRLAEAPQERPMIGAHDAVQRAQRMPPPLTNDDLPFGPAQREASTPAAVAASVEQLAAWLRPDKLAEATLTYSVPLHVIDATLSRVLRAALAFGIAVPDDWGQLAVEHHIARDIASLVYAQLSNFRQRVECGDNDLEPAATEKNWGRLLSLANVHHVKLDAAWLEVPTPQLPGYARPRPTAQHPMLRTARGLSPVRVASPARRFEKLSLADLCARLEDPQEPDDRREVARELCVRNQPDSLDLVFSLLPLLRTDELPEVFAHIVALGEAAGERLLAVLSAPNAALRQLAALALARLKFTQAIAPLREQLVVESADTGIHPELARALGEFGSAAVRPIARGLAAHVDPERLGLALAHAANHGAAKEVERLENDGEVPVAHAARRAMARRSRLAWEDLTVREQRSLGEGQRIAQLSQAFYAELLKVAI